MARRELPLWQSLPLGVALLTAGAAVSFLPRGPELLLGRLLGRLALAVDFKRRRIAEENIARCFPEKSDEERLDLLKKNYAHWGTIAFEFLHMFTPWPGHYRRYVLKNSVLTGREHWDEAEKRGKGILFIGSHIGNWEMVAAQSGLHNFRLTMVTRRLTPPWLHRWMESRRNEMGMKLAYQPRTLPLVLKALRGNESAGFVIDQYAPPGHGGVKVRFFGYLVDTLAAVGPVAHKTGAAVLPVIAFREETGLIRVTIEPELSFGEAAGDPIQSTQIIAHKIEDWIRKHPEQWTWGHRRFKEVDFSDYLPRYNI